VTFLFTVENPYSAMLLYVEIIKYESSLDVNCWKVFRRAFIRRNLVRTIYGNPLIDAKTLK